MEVTTLKTKKATIPQEVKLGKAVWLTSVVAMLLTACGGGGSDGNSSASSTSVEIVTVSTSATDAALSLLQNQRTSCGFQKLTENSTLNTAAYNHAHYLVSKATAGHYETDSANTYYRGYDLQNRLQNSQQLYSNGSFQADEQVTVTQFNSLASFNSTTTSVRAQNTLRGLLSAPYHMKGLLDDDHDIGMNYAVAQVGSQVYAALEIIGAINNPTTARLTANMPADTVVTYPCQGTANTKTALYNESPNPISGRNLGNSPIGQPIYIRAPKANQLTLNSASLTEVNSGNSVNLIYLTNATDPNTDNGNKLVATNELFLIPDTAGVACTATNKPSNFTADNCGLTANTTYRVNYNIGVDGESMSNSFTFTTGDANFY